MAVPRSRPLAAAAVLALLALTAGCGGGGGASTSGGLLHPTQPAPHLAGTTLDGAALDATRAFRGKVVVVNFYASWCSPCRSETPLLVRAAADTSADGVQFLGVLFKDSATNGRSFRQTFKVTWPSLVDDEGVMLAGFKHVNASAIPDTFVVDRRGRVAARWIGGVQDEADFARVLHTVAGTPA